MAALRLPLSLWQALSDRFLSVVILAGAGAGAFLASLSEAPGKIAAACGAVPSAICEASREGWFRSVPPLLLLTALIAGWRKTREAAERLDDRLFARFDLSRFVPLGASLPAAGADAPLPWIEAEDGARRSAWEALVPFATAPDVSAERRFGWAIITGRPGAGKSRLAEEFARRLATPDSEPSRIARAGEWLRRAIGPLRTRATDRWHVGRVRGDHVGSGWVPTRSTLLLLDDPAPGRAGAVIAALDAGRAGYRFPVRLLIVNQTRPHELASVVPSMLPALALASTSPMSAAEFGKLLVALEPSGGPLRRALFPLLGRLPFLEATRGNPFLIELGLDWVRHGLDPAAITETSLLTHRASRVVAALAAAGVGADQRELRLALATATLVGPRARRRPIVEAFGLPLPTGVTLAALVPGDDCYDPATELPCILPHRIGDAAARQLVEADPTSAGSRDEPDELGRLSTAAFLASPSGWLRAQRRLAGAEGPLAEALRRAPAVPADRPALRLEVSQAYLELALHSHLEPLTGLTAVRDLLDGAPATERPGLVQRLRTRLEQVAAIDAEARRGDLAAPPRASDAGRPVDGDEEEPRHRFIAPVPMWLLGALLLPEGSAAVGALANLATAIVDLGIGGDELDRNPEVEQYDPAVNETVRALILPRMATVPPGHDYRPLAMAADRLMQLRAANHAHVLFEALQIITDPAGSLCSSMRRRSFSVAARLSSPADCLTEAGLIDADYAAWREEDAGSISFAVAKAWTYAGHAHALQTDNFTMTSETKDQNGVRITTMHAPVHDLSGGRETVERLERHLDRSPIAETLVAVHLRVLGWRLLSGSFGVEQDVALAAAGHIEALAEGSGTGNDPRILFERMAAWTNVAHAALHDLAACRLATERVEALAARSWTCDRHAMALLASANQTLAFAAKDIDAAECRRAVERVEAIVARDSFTTDRPILCTRLWAWYWLRCAHEKDAVMRSAVDLHVRRFVESSAFRDDPVVMDQVGMFGRIHTPPSPSELLEQIPWLARLTDPNQAA